MCGSPCVPSGQSGSTATKSVILGVIHSMFGTFLTSQFSMRTGRETSLGEDYGSKHFVEYACVLLLRWWFGGSGPLVFNLSLLLCGQHGHAQSIQLRATSQTCARARQRALVSPPHSAVPFGEWSQSVDTGGNQLCPSCLGVTVNDFLQRYC